MDRASASETVDSGSIPPRVKPKTIKKSVFTATLLDVQQLKGQCEASTMCGIDRWAGVTAWLDGRKVLSLSPGQGNLVNKM